ncbi:gliding motility lipoprotein GldD [Sphingobacterium rhinopitheci]|uniref:gliding motility lipoprotein GldD n=1 Tax=Sphingobacterium rhinopitheci TaxID=2781960 RepID=UPI001F525733|nr:gliding motility lipoprotein GldD [Sphingobacterium rhinopitheci]MCI0921501.1 gliding motility lipoprotein GldD [Sphingobacterium rhinopitheci]
MQQLIWLFFLVILYSSCANQDFSPKPRGFHRIEFPDKEYIKMEEGCPFTFEIPIYTTLKTDDTKNAGKCWKNLAFPQFNATLHLSYFDIDEKSTFNKLIEDARTFAFKHTTKATSIDQKKIINTPNNIYGLEYYIQGNTASNYQFYVSDSTNHYLRGALYFNEKPNLDSIQPVLDFLKTDIEHLISTIRWK